MRLPVPGCLFSFPPLRHICYSLPFIFSFIFPRRQRAKTSPAASEIQKAYQNLSDPCVPGQEESAGDQGHELTQEGSCHICHAVPQAGSEIPGDHGYGGRNKGQRDDLKGRDAQIQHGFPGGEKAKERPSGQMKDQSPCQRNRTGRYVKDLSGFQDPVRAPGSVVIACDGNGGLAQAVHGHKKEVLQLVIDAEKGHCRRGKGQEDGIEGRDHKLVMACIIMVGRPT